MNRKFLIFSFALLLIGLVGIEMVSAQIVGSASYVTRQQPASFQTYYGDRINDYWPILNDKDLCTAREDILLQIAPGGCQPAVVRSDLLAEQNVPVFCQVDALNINPLLDIKEIRNIRFGGEYPKEVATVGFHPARAALLTRDKLLGDPLINNIGYVVVVLKKTPKEADLPEFINVNLNAQLDYSAGNVLGVGRSEFVLQTQTDTEWNNEKDRQSFWNGKYFVRLEDATDNYADVSIYSGDRKISATRVAKGQTSQEIFVPESICRAALQIQYAGFEDSKIKARLEVGSNNGTDIMDLYEGSKFMDGQCVLNEINVGSTGDTGNVSISCGSSRFLLALKPYGDDVFSIFVDKDGNRVLPKLEGENYVVDFKNNKYRLDKDNSLYVLKVNEFILVGKNEKSTELVNLEKALIEYKHFKEGSPGAGDLLIDRQWDANTESNFTKALNLYEQVVRDFPAEIGVEGGETFAEQALGRAIDLAEKLGKEKQKVRLMNIFVEKYPSSSSAGKYQDTLDKSAYIDFSSSTNVVEINGRFKNLRLVKLNLPSKDSKAEFAVNSQRIKLVQGESYILDSGKNLGFSVDRIEKDKVYISSECSDFKVRRGTIMLDNGIGICGKTVVFKNAEIEQEARIRILPKTWGNEGQTNLSVNIGIEKRAIKLSNDKALDRIENLNESIAKWENLNKNLGDVVTGLKGACFATAGVITAKNFLTGLSGEGFSRQKVMDGENGWTQFCANAVSAGNEGYKSVEQCLIDKSDEINKDVSCADGKINSVNNIIKDVESKNGFGNNVGTFGKTVDTNKVVPAYRERILKDFPNEEVVLKDGTSVKVSALLADKNGYSNGDYSYNQLRDLHYNLLLNECDSSVLKKNSESNLKTIAGEIEFNNDLSKKAKVAEALTKDGFASAFVAGSKNQGKQYVDVVKISSTLRTKVGAFSEESITHTSSVIVPQTNDFSGSGEYVLGLKENTDGSYSVEKIVEKKSDGIFVAIDDDKKGDFAKTYGIGVLYPQNKLSYSNKYLNAEVRYYETEPYKGMPAIVPFDLQKGWYAGTKQTLPAFGGVGSFESSGRVSSFWLCNVGENGREQFFEGLGDDICEMVNMNTGQVLGKFPGLSDSEAQVYVSRAIKAIDEAARQKGTSKWVSIGSVGNVKVGKPAVNLPSAQCSSFMSPKECQLIYNVCDPVICPSSRCDFGGSYPVSDVIQSGIIGSTLLCLPNFPQVKVPVCLSGIHAGIEGYVSIMKAHRDCLQESVDSGKLIGVCDQLYSIYTCELFWRELAPLAKILVPKILESAYGQNVRGGGEYLTVMSAWQNTRSSIDYFTQVYGVNAFKAFKARSVEEAGGEFCKSFISAKAPSSLKVALQPDSPPQFHASFSSTKFTDVTVPATAQYKVFYHIYAGNDAGVQYRVYLKGAPESSYYASNPYVQVAVGFAGKGEYVDETKDFTAPEGYKELCVNINGEEKCGFKEVTTSFAVNYVSDQIVSDELKNSNIHSERECISGGISPSALLNTNLGSVAGDAISPAIYERGVVRICSTNNPGTSTDPTRFDKVGDCGDAKISCWLDRKSIQNSITSNNKGIINETISDLNDITRMNLESGGAILSEKDASAEVNSFRGFVEKLDSDSAKEYSNIDGVLSRMNSISDLIYYNHQKAEILFLKGRIYESLSKKLSGKQVVNVDNNVQVDNINSNVKIGGVKLSGNYKSNSDVMVVFNDSNSKFSFSYGQLIYNSKVYVGNVEGDGTIRLNDGFPGKLNSLTGYVEQDKTILDYLAGKNVNNLDVVSSI
ncbi:hypothetical protein COU54_00975 [Candidatus Pacearchaeota archaeon CG10_big_fil_rev_8_21_14_0_10_31_24]|nr:MAG: hypothetical protein COU54_00975 [Candidatus Pacearchaeota archaeon CG10_big_fil_rev_8_21_14_0_10_31_24]